MTTTKDLLDFIESQHKKRIEIIQKKSADYAKPELDTLSNFKNSTIVGVSIERGILVRVMDKISRISNLLDKDPSVVDESIADSLNDSCNYLDILSYILEAKKNQSFQKT